MSFKSLLTLQGWSVKRLVPAIVVIVAALVVLVVTAGLSADDTTVSAIAYMELLLPAVGTAIGVRQVVFQYYTDCAPILGIGVYTGLLGGTLLYLAPRWLPDDKAEPIMFLLGALTLAMAASFILVSLGYLLYLRVNFKRRRQPVLWAVLLAVAAAVPTILLLLARGADDWATDSHALRLYSLPIIVITGAASYAIFYLSAE